MGKMKKNINLFLLLFIILISIGSNNFPQEKKNLNQLTNSLEKDFPTDLTDNERSTSLKSISSSGASTWWDENFDLRIQINITEPNIMSRSYEPVTLYFTFDNNTVHENSTRIIYYSGATQTEVSSQTWNKTYWTDGGSPTEYLKSCSITFSVTIAKGATRYYYLYASSTPMATNDALYYIDTGMSTSFDPINERAVVDTDSLYLQFGKDSAIDTLKFEDTDTINYHTDTSLSPLSAVIAGGSSSTYSPDSNGFIKDWLLVGSFDTSPNLGWTLTPTVYHDPYGAGIYNMIDPTKLYVEGDYATAPQAADEACDRGIDESKQWFAHHDADDYINLQDSTIFGVQDDEVAYGMVYVYFPNDVVNGYALLGSDDGVRLYMDGALKWENHVLRGPGTDQDSASLGTIAAGWHSFIIMVEERGGGWGFRMRLSSAASYVEIPGLTITHIPKINIESVSLIEEGPIFSTFQLTWEDSATMKTWDTITFYRDYPLYQFSRTFWWRDDINETTGNDWTIFNTNYPTATSTGVDVYVEDSATTTRLLTSDDFNAENYVITYDSSGNNEKIAYGVFVTNLAKGNPLMTFSSANLTAYYTSDHPNIVCGYQTDLDNNGPRTGDYPTGANYNVTIDFWEMAKKYLPITSPTINQEIEGYYNSLLTPLEYTIEGSEDLFYNLGFELTDRDNLPASNVNVTLYNTTADWSGYYTSIGGANTFEPVSQVTDEAGETTFFSLKSMNLTCKISYQAYSKPEIILRWVNLTLDTTQTISVADLNLTQIVLNLQNYDNPSEAIIGANVSLYWNNTNPTMDSYGGFVGSEISDDSGQVVFYYLNNTETTGNYTVKVYSYGSYRLLNYTVVDVGTYTFQTQVNFTVPNITIHTISVQMESFNAQLSRLTNNPSDPSLGLINTHYWMQNLTIIANYTYGTDIGGYVGIADALINYEIVDDSLGQVVHSGIVASNGTTGYYDLTFNSSDPTYGLDTNRRYVLYIYAFKAGFEPLTTSVSIELMEIETELLVSYNDYSPYWFENFTATAYYNDTINNKPIIGAIISWDSGLLSGNFTELGNGWYEYEFNTTQFPNTGLKSISSSANKNHYETQISGDDITINIITTELTSLHPLDTIVAYWEDNLTISVNFTDTYYNQNVENSDVSFVVTGIPALFGDLVYQGDGLYEIELNSTQFLEAKLHYIQITAEKEHYATGNIEITLDLRKVPTNLTAVNQYISVYWEENFTLSVRFFDTYRDLPIIQSADVSSTLVGSTLFDDELESVGGGYYNITYNSTQFDTAGNYTFVISAQRNQYELKTVLVYVQIKIIPTSISTNHLDNSLTAYWNDEFTLSVNLTDTYRNQPIPDATILVDTVRNSSMDLPMTYIGGFTYNLTLNSSILEGADEYIFRIEAKKNQYLTVDIYIYVDILAITTNISTSITGNELSVSWLQNFTLSIVYGDTHNDVFLDEGVVSYTVTGPEGFTDMGTLLSTGVGVYSQELNSTSFGKAGTYSFVILAENENYESRSLTITVNIIGVPTDLIYTEDINVIWTDTVILQIRYRDIDNNLNPMAISGATVIYNVSSIPGLSGTLNYNSGTGYYWIELDSTDFDGVGNYLINIRAFKEQYTSQQTTVNLEVQAVPTEIEIVTTSYVATWEENFTIEVNFNDLNSEIPITDGTIAYLIGQVAGFNGNFTHITGSLYRLNLVTTDFPGVGSYTLLLQASKDNYETQPLTLYLTVNAIRTKINDTIFLASSDNIYVGTARYYYFSYSREDTGALIANATSAYFECEYTLEGTKYFFTQNLEDMGNGVYRLDLTTISRPMTTYTLAIYVGKDNFITRAGSLVLNILPRNIHVQFGGSFQANILELAEGDDLIIDFTLEDSVTGLALTEVTVSMVYRGVTYPIDEISAGRYQLTIDSASLGVNALVAAVTQNATITLTKTNYTIAPQEITISITPPEFTVGSVSVPRIFVYIGGAVALLAIAVAGTTRYIRYARIPMIIKQIDRTRKLISGGKVIADENLTQSYEEEIVELYEDAWEILDLDLNKILGTSQPSSNTTLEGLGDTTEGGF